MTLAGSPIDESSPLHFSSLLREESSSTHSLRSRLLPPQQAQRREKLKAVIIFRFRTLVALVVVALLVVALLVVVSLEVRVPVVTMGVVVFIVVLFVVESVDVIEVGLVVDPMQYKSAGSIISWNTFQLQFPF